MDRRGGGESRRQQQAGREGKAYRGRTDDWRWASAWWLWVWQINIEQGGVKLRLLNYDVLKPKARPPPKPADQEEGELAME